MSIFAEPGASTDADVVVPAPVLATVSLEMTLGPPLTSISQQSGVLEAGATQWVYVKADLLDAATGFPVDPATYPAALAITQADPLPADFAPATWLRRAAEPDAGVYVKVLAGPGSAALLGTGRWRAYVQILAGGEVLEARAPGYLIVE